MLVSDIRENRTNLKNNDHEYAMIDMYKLALNIMEKECNGSDNEVTLSSFSVACLRCGNNGHKSSKYIESNSSKNVKIT